MKNRILANFLIAFIVMPLFRISIDYYSIEIANDQTFYSGTFLEYEKLMLEFTFLYIPVIFLTFILIPYNYLSLRMSRSASISFTSKLALFFILMLALLCVAIIAGSGIPPFILGMKLLIGVFSFSAISVAILHHLADKKEN